MGKKTKENVVMERQGYFPRYINDTKEIRTLEGNPNRFLVDRLNRSAMVSGDRKTGLTLLNIYRPPLPTNRQAPSKPRDQSHFLHAVHDHNESTAS